jgi:hypothetical protein
MTPDEFFLALASTILSVWVWLYTAALTWLTRCWSRLARRRVQTIRSAARERTRKSLIRGLDAMFALGTLLALALCIVPLLLTVAPVLLAIGALEFTAHLVRISR